MGDKPRRVGSDEGSGRLKTDREVRGITKPEEMREVPDTEKWISTPVPAPKRSTLGVVAALDSVVGLCSGIESNISKNKDTQLYVHSDFKSSAFGMS